MMKRLLLAAFVATLVGCASDWTHGGYVRDVTGRGRTQADYNSDLAGCDYEATAAAAGSAYRPAPYPNVTTGNMTGTGRAFENLGAAFIGPNPVILLQKCMAARGWAPA